MNKILLTIITVILSLNAWGQNDSILMNIRSQLPNNWELTITDNFITVSSTDLIGVLSYNPKWYNEDPSPDKVASPTMTPVITYAVFDILDYHKLDSTLIRIENLKQIIKEDFDKCYVGLCDIVFVQYKNVRGDRRAARRLERKSRKRNSICSQYDIADSEVRKLLDLTPIYFSQNYALGTPKLNWKDELCENLILRIQPTQMSNEIEKVLEILNKNLQTRPNHTNE